MSDRPTLDEVEVTPEMIAAAAAAIWCGDVEWSVYDSPTGAETIARKVIEAALKVRRENHAARTITG